MTPYSEEICAILENAFQTNQFNKNVTFQMGKKKNVMLLNSQMAVSSNTDKPLMQIQKAERSKEVMKEN